MNAEYSPGAEWTLNKYLIFKIKLLSTRACYWTCIYNLQCVETSSNPKDPDEVRSAVPDED